MNILIIGGGAAGFMAAITAKEKFPQTHVTIVERNQALLSKVRISGGGRCNVTQKWSEPGEFSKNYPRGSTFMKKTLYAFGPEDIIQWFNDRGVKLKTEADGRVFPITDSSGTIIDTLLQSAASAGVKIHLKTPVIALSLPDTPDKHGFYVTFSNNEMVYYDRVLVACGGFPKSDSYDWIAALGLKIVPPQPSLFTFNTPSHPFSGLQGVSVNEAVVHISGTRLSAKGPVLITHWGFSGPAVLKLSAFSARELAGINYNFDFEINWLPDYSIDDLQAIWQVLRRNTPSKKILMWQDFKIPSRLWNALLQRAGINDTVTFATVSGKQLNKLTEVLHRSKFSAMGKTTFKEEFVTAGGVDLTEIDHRTMESKKVPGLYFAGEIMDVDGVTGGYNFQHAWTSGFIAGQHIGRL